MPERKPPVTDSPEEDEELDVALIILRAALRWKQNDLARASGIGNSSISDYERRKKAPGRKNLRKMLASMGYRESVLELTRRFLYDLRTTQRLATGEEIDVQAPATGEVGLRARIDQVTGEVGQASEHLIRLICELMVARGGPSDEAGS